MNSISLQNPVVQGVEFGWQLGSKDSDRWAVNYGGSEEMMAVIETAIEMGNLTGFTLFEHPGKGWQMSCRPKGENGWVVKIIPDNQARAILAMLENDSRFARQVDTLAKAAEIADGFTPFSMMQKPDEMRAAAREVAGSYSGKDDSWMKGFHESGAKAVNAAAKEAHTAALRALTAAFQAWVA